MASPPFLHLLLFFLLSGFASSTTLSNNIFGSQVMPGRSLLQQKASCDIDFENQNYTIITSQCKGPNYQAKACCGAFKELACPFSEKLNDMKNDCATTLFSYINLYGKYPPGLFANMCHDDKEGLNCEEVMKAKEKQQKSSSAAAAEKSTSLIMFSTASFLILLFNLC
ncbi:GPI-anchored protein LORELEI [Heracleum sosnowskyi]|uniref:GPI-anchored protein LORELEI n=1 Tax=Heracleum sosnowskyi TaxID=360622 RepID=A0AAD8HH48_9APIA|nr:GPI-anchored protein LORELEI [Heracleum sosnowskyi]